MQYCNWIPFEKPPARVTQEKVCVFYQEDLVVGGGWITIHKSASVTAN